MERAKPCITAQCGIGFGNDLGALGNCCPIACGNCLVEGANNVGRNGQWPAAWPRHNTNDAAHVLQATDVAQAAK
jgi:hypothetical protein